jgi:sugar lactone lactonase YvrE
VAHDHPGRLNRAAAETQISGIGPAPTIPDNPIVRTTSPAAFALMVALAVTAMAPPAGASTTALRTVVPFDRAKGETPENLAIAPDGTVYVSLSFAGDVRRIATDGEQENVSLPTGGGLTVGIVTEPGHGDDVDVAVESAVPADAGIWRIPRAAFGDPTVSPSRIAPLPTAAFPNGLAFDAHGNLYIADSTLGRIWRLTRGSSTPTVWATSPLFDPTGASFDGLALPGANGMKVHDGVVYTSNTSTDEILAIPIGPDGTAGPVSVRYHLDEPDDFAIARDGTMYVALNVPDLFVRVTPDGHVTTLFSGADGLDNPSAALFSPGRRGHDLLYITNSAYFGAAPSLQVTRIG